MRFPVQCGSSQAGLGAKPGQCPICHKGDVGEPRGFAFLNGGALKKLDGRTSAPADDLEAFLTLGYHGAHAGPTSESSATLSIAEDVPIGQFEYYFCSTACLRQFLNRCVDELERKVANHDA